MIMGQLDTPGFTLFTIISEAVSQARLEVVIGGYLVQDVGQAALGVAEVLGVEVNEAGGDQETNEPLGHDLHTDATHYRPAHFLKQTKTTYSNGILFFISLLFYFISFESFLPS